MRHFIGACLIAVEFAALVLATLLSLVSCSGVGDLAGNPKTCNLSNWAAPLLLIVLAVTIGAVVKRSRSKGRNPGKQQSK